MEVQFTFLTIVMAILKLFILMMVGYFLYHKKMIDDKFTDSLGLLLIRVIFPALIISKTITHFSFSEYPFWWILPIAAILFCFLGMGMGMLASLFFKGFPLRKEFVSCCGFQNCGYLPMNIIIFSFTGIVFQKLLIYLFLFILGFNVLMWSLVPLFLSGHLRSNFRLKVFLNPPVVATLFSLVWVALFGKGSIPSVVMDPIRQLGGAAFPIAMITLGAYLSRYQAHNPSDKKEIFTVSLIKLVILPAIVLLAIAFLPIDNSYKFFLFLQSIMPTAVSLVFIGSYVGTDTKFFSSSIFYTHLIAIFSIPLWLALFNVLIK